jgi:hypothetical protein
LKGFQALEAELAEVEHATPLEKIIHVMRVYLRERYFPNSILASIGPEIVVRIKCSNEEVREGMRRFEGIMSQIVDEAKQRGDIRRDFCILPPAPPESPHRRQEADLLPGGDGNE